MATPKPTGITSAGHGNQWFTVSWNPVPGRMLGLKVRYESQHQDEAHVSPLVTPTSALLAIPYGTTRYTRIRNVVDDEPSGWVRVTMDDRGEITDIDGGDDPQQPPAPPAGLHLVSTDPEYASATVGWDPARDADYWEVLLEDVYQRYRKANSNEYTFSDLVEGSEYGWRVRAVRKIPGGSMLRSAPTRSTFTYEVNPPPPPPEAPHAPRNVRAHCVHPRHAKIEWDPNTDTVDGYQVKMSDGGTLDLVGTLAEVSGLSPNTRYTATVYAHRGGKYSQGSQCQFTTGSEEPEPDPPDPNAPPAPTGLYVDPVGGGKVRAAWEHASPSSTWWLASIDDRVWHRVTKPEVTFTGVPAGAQRRVQVYALVDGTGGKPTAISRITAGGVVTARETSREGTE